MIRRCPRPTGNFCVINNDVINDPRLSWDSRGTLLYLLSKPDHWAVSVANLVNQTIDAIRLASGRDTVYAMLRELMIARYVKRVQLRREDGTMAGVEYIVSELPFEDVDVGDDFLPRKQRVARRPSRAARGRSFSAISTMADEADETGERAVDAPCGDALATSLPRDFEASAWAPVDVIPRRIVVTCIESGAEQAAATAASPHSDRAQPSEDRPFEPAQESIWRDDSAAATVAATATGRSPAPVPKSARTQGEARTQAPRQRPGAGDRTLRCRDPGRQGR